MQALSGNTVYTDQWDARITNNMPHIDLTRDADAMAAFAAGEYGKVLSKPELRRFLDLEEGARPALPVDTDRFKP